MANISFDGREPVRLTWDAEGKLREAHALDSNQRRTFDDEVLRSSEIMYSTPEASMAFSFLCGQEEFGPARTGYLIFSPAISPKGFRCLKVHIPGEWDRINPNSVSSGTIVCRAGILLRPTPTVLPVSISMKQTAHQNWAAVLFRRIIRELDEADAIAYNLADPDQMEFCSGGDCLVEEREKIRLSMLLYAEFWHRYSVSKEAKQKDLEAIGLNVGGASTVSTMFERMKLEIWVR